MEWHVYVLLVTPLHTSHHSILSQFKVSILVLTIMCTPCEGGGTCYWGAVNEGCVVMGKPHPSHPFAEPHPTVYETALAYREKFRRMKFWRMKKQGLQDEGVDYSSHCMRAFVWEPSKSHTNALIQLLKFHFFSFQGWSWKGAWSWWLVPFFLPFRRKK